MTRSGSRTSPRPPEPEPSRTSPPAAPNTERGTGVAPWFDVERWRSSAERTVVVRRPSGRALILGPTQGGDLVDRSAAESSGTEVVQRRSGGGAVLVAPEDPLWVDLWLPRGDALWEDDVVRAAFWVGAWWSAALGSLGVVDPRVHEGPSVEGPWSRLVCFAGIGPGEVSVGRRKVVGVSQWRARQGALFQTCAYRQWEPRPLVELLGIPEPDRGAVTSALEDEATGFEPLGIRSLGSLRTALLSTLPAGAPWRRGA